MATNKPRVSVNLDPDVFKIIQEFCSLSGRSMSSFLAESASDAAPMLSQLIPLLRVAKDMQSHSQSVVAAAVDRVKADLSGSVQGLMDMVGNLDQLPPSAIDSRPSENDAEGADDQTPLLLTRGSVNQSMHQNSEYIDKPKLWLASSSEVGGK